MTRSRRAMTPALFTAALLAACRGEPSAATRDPGTEPGAGPLEPRVVSLSDVALRIEPQRGAGVVTEVPAGTVLAVVADTVAPGTAASEPWLRVATWDDRRGWIPAEQAVEPELWSLYSENLGGSPPTALRAAYPLAGGRWGAEAPLNSPGFTGISTVWLLADSARLVRVAGIDSVADVCGRPHRMALLVEGVEGRAALAVPASRRPVARRLEIAAVQEADPQAVAAALRAVDRHAGSGRAGAIPGNSSDWTWSLGERARWVTLRWSGEDGDRAAAALLVRQSNAVAKTSGWTARTVVPSVPIEAPAGRAPLVPAAAYATGDVPPTLLMVEALEYAGEARIDLYLAVADDYRRLRAGYSWGCRTVEAGRIPETGREEGRSD